MVLRPPRLATTSGFFRAANGHHTPRIDFNAAAHLPDSHTFPVPPQNEGEPPQVLQTIKTIRLFHAAHQSAHQSIQLYLLDDWVCVMLRYICAAVGHSPSSHMMAMAARTIRSLSCSPSVPTAMREFATEVGNSVALTVTILDGVGCGEGKDNSETGFRHSSLKRHTKTLETLGHCC